MPVPTEEAYGELQQAYDHFNARLFGGELPACLITLQREKRAYGYFSPARFVDKQGQRTDEIAMNPCFFAVIPLLEVLQTLAHEMTHLWQAHFGSPGRRGYHNAEWADRMEEIGLMPSSTGKPGGRRVGEKMSDYVIPGGRFELACEELMAGDFRITWRDRHPVREKLEQALAGAVEGVEPEQLYSSGIALHDTDAAEGADQEAPASKSNRRKYACSGCATNVWGKPGLNLICGNCDLSFDDVGT